MMNLVRTVGVLFIVLVALFLAWRSARKASVTRYPSRGAAGRAGPGRGAARRLTASAPEARRRCVGGRGCGDRFERNALPAAPDVNDELAELIDRQPTRSLHPAGWLADRRA